MAINWIEVFFAHVTSFLKNIEWSGLGNTLHTNKVVIQRGYVYTE